MVTSRTSAAVTAEDADWLAIHLQRMVATHPTAWASADLTLPQLTALHFIRAEGPLTLAGLAQALGTRPPATSAMVDRLARAGLVRRTPDTKDQRRIRLAVTGAAEPMIGKVDSKTARRVQAVLHSMSPAARRCLTDVLKDTARRLAG
ncbi:MAG: MarR family transcriptional regulator [Pseudonocardiaceae bacterium]